MLTDKGEFLQEPTIEEQRDNSLEELWRRLDKLNPEELEARLRNIEDQLKHLKEVVKRLGEDMRTNNILYKV